MNETILIVDDEPGIREAYRFLLEPLGYRVILAVDGLDALGKVRQVSFDWILLDVHMPRLRGPETLKQILLLVPQQKVLMLSSGSDPKLEFENMAASRGATACLFKPVSAEELLEVLEHKEGPKLQSEAV